MRTDQPICQTTGLSPLFVVNGATHVPNQVIAECEARSSPAHRQIAQPARRSKTCQKARSHKNQLCPEGGTSSDCLDTNRRRKLQVASRDGSNQELLEAISDCCAK